ncbi:MAG TPA: cyclopropane-fatty-acyl-phospholipid synthase family protein [Pseudomonadales bacterium]|nr:cyclopropane-fatty-acyl-phospholipid synthase family protein [Pseudomonadales bacterium]
MNAMLNLARHINRGLSLLHKPSSIPDSIQETPDNLFATESMYRSAVFAMLKKIRGGRLAVFENGKVYSFGALQSDSDINASIRINHAEMWRDVVTRGSIGAGEAYMAGYWTSPDLTQVIRLLVRNRDILLGLDGQQSFMARMALKAAQAMNRNTPEGSQQNIRAHYDLSNAFFELFLDPSMMYSSAVFRHPVEPLAEASQYKLQLVCQQLQLTPDDHLLEIGTGWGGMAIYAARHYGCRVTTTTISQEQYDYARARIEQEGLSHRITLLLMDYRELTGHYDKLVSIEMIEAVGAEFQQVYFEICDNLLKPGSRALIQAITIRDDLYERYLQETDFIRQYIFPGGCLPTVTRIRQLTREHTELELLALSDITADYALTLNHWRQRFLFNSKQVMALGFDLSFMRMWEFYLCYCEGGFLEHSIGTHQLLFTKHRALH